MVHCENGSLIAYNQKKILDAGVTGPEGHFLSRNKEVEAEATHRMCVLANEVLCPLYIVHVMGQEAAQQVEYARRKGWLVYGETLATALASDGTNYFNKDWDHAAGHVMSPALCTNPQTKIELMRYLSAGILQTVGTDNCTFSKK